MALSDPYATHEDYRAQRTPNKAVSSEADDLINSDLLTCSRYLDDQLGRSTGFNRDESIAERVYTPNRSSAVLWIDDCVSVSAITVDTNDDGLYALTLTAADYDLEPANASLNAQPWPYTRIRATRRGQLGGRWNAGVRVQVTGYFGWPSVPEAIKKATIELAGILRIESPRATSRVQEGNIFIGNSREAQQIIARIPAGYANVRGMAR